MNHNSLIFKAANYFWLHLWKYKANERQHKRYVTAISGRTPINVVFMAIDVALWRYQHVYEMMAADNRFNVSIVLTPCIVRNYERDLESLRNYFEERGIPYIDYRSEVGPIDIRSRLNPDVMFYTQPYEYLLIPEYDCRRFFDRLVCYMPYAFWTFATFAYNLHFCNRAWRLYYPLESYRQSAVNQASNHGRNVRVVGYANADDYLKNEHTDVWKPMADGQQRKRIIWAPHFTIQHIEGSIPARSNFLWMAQLMVDIAQTYSDRLQIAFKPHPSLMTQLYSHPDWGKERTDQYYELWQQMPNTQLETGQYADLFMTSDAMIHDSGSFAVEYHYSQNPVMFMSKDMEDTLSTQSDFGKQAYAMHYIGANEQDIRRFIDDVVLGGNDPMRPQREHFFKEYLLPPGGKSVAQNVIDDIVKSLNL